MSRARQSRKSSLNSLTDKDNNTEKSVGYEDPSYQYEDFEETLEDLEEKPTRLLTR